MLEQNVDVTPIKAALDRQPELWNEHYERTVYSGSAHREASDIWVRYNDKKNLDPNNPKAFADLHLPVWYGAWYKLPELKPFIFGLMDGVRGEVLGGVLITKLPPGKKVYEHIDKGWHVEYYDKFYLTIQAEGDNTFYAGQDEATAEKLVAKTGDLYLFDNRGKHWIVNNSDKDRITLIVCIRTEMFGRK